MRSRTRGVLRPLVLAVAAALTPAAAHAQFTLVEDGATRLTLGGYVRALTGIHDRGYTVPATAVSDAVPERSGFHGQVVRLRWRLEGGPGGAGTGTSWQLDVHNRLQARVSSDEAGGRAVGFGVSTIPGRLLDLESELVDDPGLRVWHDIDRLSLTVYTDIADITAGRQAITWGTSGLFPVADLWTQFSPFELDTEEKPGIDAVRILSYPAPGLELDAVLADRGTAEDLSVGLRGTYGLADADVWAGAGKFWRELIVMGGLTVLLDQAKLRAEAALPWDLDAETLDPPRVTLGVDWIRGTLTVTGEYHYNGIGASVDGYLEALGDPRVQRGESYYLGTHYVGALTSWSPDVENRITLALSALANVEDPSASLTPTVSYDIGQATRLAVGGLLSLGDPPSFAPAPAFPTEFGAYGTLAFTQLSIYF